MKVLIIEPDLILAQTYRQAMESGGHEAVICPGAQSGIFVADTEKPDLVVAEIQLVGHSGIEFLYEFRSYPDWRTVPVLLHTQVPISEFAGSWEVMKSELGVAGYLYKPGTTLKQLAAAVNACMIPA